MSYAKKALATGAAGMMLAAGGALPALAAGTPQAGGGSLTPPVGRIFSGTIEVASTQGLLIGRRSRKNGGTTNLEAVDTDAQTVVTRGGLALSVEDLSSGAEVIVSGTRTEEGSLLASKIIIRS